MSYETGERHETGINKAESNHRGRRRFRNKEQRELVNEVSVSCRVAKCSRVVLGRQNPLANAELAAKIVHLLAFGFEVPVVEMGQDKIQSRELGANVLDGMFAAIAEVLATDGSINQTGMEVVNASISQEQLGRCVALPEQFLSEGQAL